jgi:hypothetical protein
VGPLVAPLVQRGHPDLQVDPMSSSITLVTADYLQQNAVLGYYSLVHSASVMQVLKSDSLLNDRAFVTYIIKANGLGNLIRALYLLQLASVQHYHLN